MTSTIDEADDRLGRRRAGRARAGDRPDTKPDGPVAPRRRLTAGLQEHWPVLALATAAAVIAVLAMQHIFPAYSYNRDEPVYRWMADHFREGQLLPTDGGAPEFFLPWLSAQRDGAFFTHFTVGWSAVLLVGDVVFGTHAAGPVLGAALLVLATYAFARELTRDKALSLVAAAVMAASPIIPVQGGTFLSYLFSSAMGLLFATALISAVRLDRPRRLVLAGALLGFIFLTRPFDALLYAIAVGAYVVWVHRGQWRRLARSAAWMLPSLVPLLLVALAYNRLVVGGLFALPNSAADPLDRFGFGDRRMMPTLGLTDYAPGRAVKASLKNGVLLPLFLFGSYVGLLAAGYGVFLRRKERSTLVLLAIIAVFPLAYFFHWGTFVSSLVSKWSGPIYFIPMYGPLSILVATAVLATWRRRRALGIGLVALMVVATIPGAVDRLDSNRETSIAQEPWRTSVEGIDGDALIFVSRSSPYLQFFNPFSVNDPDLDGELLYAADRGADNLDLISEMPERTAYLQRPTISGDRLSVPPNNPAEFPPSQMLPKEDQLVPEVTVLPIELVADETVSIGLTTARPDEGAVSAYIDLGDGSGPQWQALRPDDNGSYATALSVRPPGTDAEGLPLTGGRLGTIAVGLAYGDAPELARQPAVRALLHYRIDGDRVEVMLPTDQQRRRSVDGREGWYQARDLPELDVVVSGERSVGE